MPLQRFAHLKPERVRQRVREEANRDTLLPSAPTQLGVELCGDEHWQRGVQTGYQVPGRVRRLDRVQVHAQAHQSGLVFVIHAKSIVIE